MSLDALPSLTETIRRHGLAADKRLGQHFLVDPAILTRIAEAAAPLAGHVVLEVGPGPGGLTRALLASGARQVTAIEADHRCVAALGDLVAAAAGRLRVLHGDALAIDHCTLEPKPSVVVANLPYNVGTELLVRWLRQPGDLTRLVLLLQREVAQRLTAAPGSGVYGRLSVLAQWKAAVRACFDLPPGAFRPAPKVHSRVVRMDLLEAPTHPAALETLERVTAAAFGQRRKMLKSSLKALGTDADRLCAAAGIDASRRAETLSVEAFASLANALDATAPESLSA